MSDPISEKLLTEAIDRIARTPDGRGLYLYCQRRLMTVTSADSDSALNKAEGERRFALELIGLMTKGITESGGRTSSSDTGSGSEQPLVFARPQPIDVRGSRGAGRRITEHTRVPGWDGPDDGSAA